MQADNSDLTQSADFQSLHSDQSMAVAAWLSLRLCHRARRDNHSTVPILFAINVINDIGS